MPTIDDDTWIDASVDEMFGYLASPAHHVDVIPSLVEGTEEGGLPNGGTEGAFTFGMLGVSLVGHFRDVEFGPLDRQVYRLEGDIEGTMTYDLLSEDGGTRVDVRNESEPPGPEFVGTLTDPLASRVSRAGGRFYTAEREDDRGGDLTRAGGDTIPMNTSHRSQPVGPEVPCRKTNRR